MPKHIFIDIDDVLRHNKFFMENPFETVMDHTDGLYKLDSSSMEELNRIVSETGADIVVSSSWRIGMNDDELEKMFRHNGYNGVFAGSTPVFFKSYTHGIERGFEIASWLSEHPGDNYCIIDDSDDMLQEQMDHFVCIEGMSGLTKEYADKAIAILSKEL